MKKLMTVLLTVLMVVTLGVVNVAAEGDEEIIATEVLGTAGMEEVVLEAAPNAEENANAVGISEIELSIPDSIYAPGDIVTVTAVADKWFSYLYTVYFYVNGEYYGYTYPGYTSTTSIEVALTDVGEYTIEAEVVGNTFGLTYATDEISTFAYKPISIPEPEYGYYGFYYINGGNREWIALSENSDYIIIEDEDSINTAVNAGEYTVTVSLADPDTTVWQYTDADGIAIRDFANKDIDWVINKADHQQVQCNYYGYADENTKAVFTFGTLDEGKWDDNYYFDKDTEFEICDVNDDPTDEDSWKDIEVKRYSVPDYDGYNHEYGYFEVAYNKDGSNKYYVRAKLDDNHGDWQEDEYSYPTEYLWKKFPITVFYLDSDTAPTATDIKFYKGEANKETIEVALNITDDFYYSYFYNLTVLVDGKPLTYKEDFTITEFDDPSYDWPTNMKLHIVLADEYANTLAKGKHDVDIHYDIYGCEDDWGEIEVATSYRTNSIINVKKHSVPADDDTPSYKVVATGIE